MKGKTIVLLLLLVISNAEAGLRMDDGTLVSAGDDISLIYHYWGRENMRLTSEKTCNRIIKLKKKYCSSRRLVWHRDGRYLMVQTQGTMIIKTGWTRSQRKLKQKF